MMSRWAWTPFPPCYPTRNPVTWLRYGIWQARCWLRTHVQVIERPALITRRIQKACGSGIRERVVGTDEFTVIREPQRPTSWLQGFCLRVGDRVLIVTTGR